MHLVDRAFQVAAAVSCFVFSVLFFGEASGSTILGITGSMPSAMAWTIGLCLAIVAGYVGRTAWETQ